MPSSVHILCRSSTTVGIRHGVYSNSAMIFSTDFEPHHRQSPCDKLSFQPSQLDCEIVQLLVRLLICEQSPADAADRAHDLPERAMLCHLCLAYSALPQINPGCTVIGSVVVYLEPPACTHPTPTPTADAVAPLLIDISFRSGVPVRYRCRRTSSPLDLDETSEKS